MDLYFLISALFGMCSVVFGAGLAAPTEHPRALSTTHSDGGVHVRTKRCSCATFLDKECVYFCHLDIIWVNTPERVVSYGLGNAPRSRRSVPGSENAESPERPRCMCLRRDDRTCQSFCRPQKRTHSGPEPVLSPKLRAVVQTLTILEKWRMRRKERSRPQRLNLLKT